MTFDDIKKEDVLFAEAAEELLALIDDVATAVRDHIPPTREACSELLRKADEVRNHYQAVVQAATSLGVTEVGKPIEWYVEASDALLSEQRELEDAVEKLHRFITVGSDVTLYDNAMESYRISARNKVARLSNDGAAGFDKELFKMEFSFLDALEMGVEGLDSEDGVQLLDALDEHYKGSVIAGLARGKYSEGVHETDTKPQERSGSEVSHTPESSVSDGTAEEFEVSAVEAKGEIDMAEPGEPSSTRSTQTAGRSPVAQADFSADSMRDESLANVAVLHCVDAPKGDCEIKGKKAFGRQLLKMSEASRSILALLSRVGAITCDAAIEIFSSTRQKRPSWSTVNGVSTAAEQLSRAGLVSRFPLPNGMTVICLTALGGDQLSVPGIDKLKVNGKQLWAIQLGARVAVADEEIDYLTLRRWTDNARLLASELRLLHDREGHRIALRVLNAIDQKDDTLVVSLPSSKGGEKSVVYFASTLEGIAQIPQGCLLTTYPELVTTEVTERLGETKICVVEDNGVVDYTDWVELHGTSIKPALRNDNKEARLDDIAGDTEEPPGETHAQLVSLNGAHHEELPTNPGKRTQGTREDGGLSTDSTAPRRNGDETFPSSSDDGGCENISIDDVRKAPEPDMPYVDEPVRKELLEDLDVVVGMKGRPSDEEMLSLALGILDSDMDRWGEDGTRCALAAAFAHAASLDEANVRVGQLNLQLALAIDSPLTAHSYSVEGISEAFAAYGGDVNNEGLLLSTYCLAMFRQEKAEDRQLWGMFETHLANYDEFFPNYPELKGLFSALNGIHSDTRGRGFSKSVVAKLGNAEQSTVALADVVAKASTLAKPRRVNGSIKGVTQAVNHICRPGGPITKALEDVARDDSSAVNRILKLVAPYVGDDVTDIRIDDAKVEETARSVWKTAVYQKHISNLQSRKLDYDALKVIKDHLVERISLLCDWLSLKTATQSSSELSALRNRAGTIREECEASLQSISGSLTRSGQAAVRLMLKMISARLEGDYQCGAIFDDFLRTGFITLDDNLVPVLSKTDDEVEYFEPWRRVLKHIVSRRTSLEDALEAIRDRNSPSYANIRQLSQLEIALGRNQINKSRYASAVSESARTADADSKKFKESLEMWFNDGRIDDDQREYLASIVDDEKDRIYSLDNFGCWYQLLDALEKQSLDIGEVQFKALEDRVSSYEGTLREDEDTSLLEAAKAHLYDEKNYSVVENYLNWFDVGVRRIEDVMPDYNPSEDDFSEFMSDEVFGPLYEQCLKAKSPSPTKSSSMRFKNIAKNHVQKSKEGDWTDSQLESSYELIRSWPSNRGYDTSQLNSLLSAFGFVVGKCSPVANDMPGVDLDHFRATLVPAEKSRQTYRHPIAMFGTHAVSSIDIVVTYENPSPTTIIELATAADASEATMIIVDYHIDRATRRQVAEACKSSEGHPNTFLLVDRILLMYLALAQRNERLPRLLKCTLPLTYHQPFTLGKDLTPDEMFCGRVNELSSIVEHGGACFVYGGRRLGKSALLNRAASLVNRPDKKQYAVRVDLYNCETEEQVAKAARVSLNATIGKRPARIRECKTLAALCDGIEKLLVASHAMRVLLLLDEADKFLALIEDDRYEQLHPLVSLHQRCPAFKFVLAGTHNVARASAATEGNGIFGQLGKPECIKPLPPRDALRLLRRPLMYLGYHIDSPNIETILTKTNYYPGLVQLLGYKLVESMSTHFGTYYSAASGNPPCPLSKRQLASILADTDVNDEVRKEFLLSLELDDRYMLLARVITALYYDRFDSGEPTSDGLSIDEIIGYVRDYDFKRVRHMTDKSLKDLLHEMSNMGVLTRSEKGGLTYYRIRRKAFLGYIGDSENVLDALDKELPGKDGQS